MSWVETREASQENINVIPPCKQCYLLCYTYIILLDFRYKKGLKEVKNDF